MWIELFNWKCDSTRGRSTTDDRPLDQVKIKVGIDDRGRNCHMDFLRAIIYNFKENDGKCSANGD